MVKLISEWIQKTLGKWPKRSNWRGQLVIAFNKNILWLCTPVIFPIELVEVHWTMALPGALRLQGTRMRNFCHEINLTESLSCWQILWSPAKSLQLAVRSAQLNYWEQASALWKSPKMKHGSSPIPTKIIIDSAPALLSAASHNTPQASVLVWWPIYWWWVAGQWNMAPCPRGWVAHKYKYKYKYSPGSDRYLPLSEHTPLVAGNL